MRLPTRDARNGLSWISCVLCTAGAGPGTRRTTLPARIDTCDAEQVMSACWPPPLREPPRPPQPRPAEAGDTAARVARSWAWQCRPLGRSLFLSAFPPSISVSPARVGSSLIACAAPLAAPAGRVPPCGGALWPVRRLAVPRPVRRPARIQAARAARHAPPAARHPPPRHSSPLAVIISSPVANQRPATSDQPAPSRRCVRPARVPAAYRRQCSPPACAIACLPSAPRPSVRPSLPTTSSARPPPPPPLHRGLDMLGLPLYPQAPVLQTHNRTRCIFAYPYPRG